MKIVRFANPAEAYGILREERIQVCRGDPFSRLEPTEEVLRLEDVSLLPPCRPTKMIAIWRNSKKLIEERNERPTLDLCWIAKPPSSFAGTGDAIVLPRAAQRVIFEAELGIVVGRRCRNVAIADAERFVFGWTAVNEVTAVDIAQRDPRFQQHGRAKSFDTFGVFGPVIETELDLGAVKIRTWQNGILKQAFDPTDFVRDPHRILSELSHDVTLEPGDVIACGSSVGVAPMSPGDVIRVQIAGIGTLENRVIAEENQLQ